MKFLKRSIAALAIMVAGLASLQAVPAPRKPLTIQQPNGTTITIVQQGDEFCHWVTDLSGKLLTLDAEGNYRQATSGEEKELDEAKALGMQRRALVNKERTERLRAGRATSAPAKANAATDSLELDNHVKQFPSKGQIHGLIVLVEYQDVKFDTTYNAHQHYVDKITKEGFSDYNHQGSAHDFYYQNSMGQFDPQFDIYGPLTLKYNRKHYGGNSGWGDGSDSRPYEMVIEACEQLDSLVDFSIYDNDGDGVIDFVFTYYAGGGEHAGAGSDAVWPHAWDVNVSGTSHYFDGVMLASYACSCEEIYGQPDGVGTFCHEFSHVLGLPDEYDVDYSGAFTAGEYSVMDQGNYNGLSSGSCPAAFSTYQRYELGWINPEPLVPGTTDTLTYLGESNKAYILPVKSSSNDPRDGEYYLFENRQQTGWDTFIPGHGMLAWHIDYQYSVWYSNTPNTKGNHQCIDLVEADNKGSDFTRNADPFPGTKNKTVFNAKTKPALLGWASHSSSKLTQPLDSASIEDIKEVLGSEVSNYPIITFAFNDVTTGGNSEEPGDDKEEDADPQPDPSTIFWDDFSSITTGSDKNVSSSTTPFEGNENFVEYTNAYMAGGAIRLGKLMAPGSLTSRNLGNPEGSKLYVEVKVKGWTNVEGTLNIGIKGQEEVQALTYAATIRHDYETLGCYLENCPADAQLTISTSARRALVSYVKANLIVEEGIEETISDNASEQQAPRKVWKEGRMMIQTGNGLYNMQGVRQ